MIRNFSMQKRISTQAKFVSTLSNVSNLSVSKNFEFFEDLSKVSYVIPMRYFEKMHPTYTEGAQLISFQN